MLLTWLKPFRLLHVTRLVAVTYLLISCFQVIVLKIDNRHFLAEEHNKWKSVNRNDLTTPVAAVEKFPSPASQVKPVIVLQTYWRSGSTFSGEMLSNYPGVFYRYEPFMYLDVFRELDSEQTKNAIETLRHLSRCEYHNVDDFFQQVGRD
ncbi:uncharacterized protein LOC111089661 [Limulus polyphemus]|uniref:Uncharacterized protein LOC111089661 n=1 Tax=Limulus polyphemus TaxID=6850 RepID=A0ABM1TQV6_LIMPO|nr:uncharacterized protein LOC111089661 [Limulus polyphemus]